MTPFAKDKWSPPFMALVVTFADAEVIVMNVYAPAERIARETFYETLATIQIPSAHHIYVGCDFDCTQHPDCDKTYGATAESHMSPALTNAHKQVAT